GAGVRLAIHGGDDVAAELDLSRRGVGGDVAAADARLLGRTAVLDALHERPGLDRQVEAGRRAVDGHAAHPEVGVLHGAPVLDLGDDLLGGVDGHGEADPDRAALTAGRVPARGLDLRVDADHTAAGVEQWAAGVARVQRR